MDSSNTNLRKVRTRTIFSIALAFMIFGGFSYLYIKISQQSIMYGEVKINLDRYTSDLDSTKNDFKSVSDQLAEVRALLSVNEQKLLMIDSDLLGAQANLDLENQKLSNSQEQLQKVEERTAGLRVDLSELNAINSQIEDRSKELEEANSKIKNLVEKRKGLTAEVNGHSSDLARLNEETLSADRKLEELNELIGAVDADLIFKRLQLKTLTSEASLNETRATTAEQRLAAAQVELSKAIPELEVAKADLAREVKSLEGVIELVAIESDRLAKLIEQQNVTD